MPKIQKNLPYECPRCGYKTDQLGCIRRHLFDRKKGCPSTKSDIVLTDEIKEYVLNNRVYRSKKDVKEESFKSPNNPSTIIQTNNINQVFININNNFNKFISNVSLDAMLPALLKCTNIDKQLSTDEMIEKSLHDWKNKKPDLKAKYRMPTPEITLPDYSKWLDKMTNVNNNEIPCLFTNNNSTGLYDPDQQIHFPIAPFDIVMLVLKKAQELFFNGYELHCKERATCDSYHNPAVTKAFDLLVDYYKILQAFGLYTTIEPPYQEAWKVAEETTTEESKKQLQEKFITIVKNNSNRNRDYVMAKIKALVMPCDSDIF